jgi:hypothetical protein
MFIQLRVVQISLVSPPFYKGRINSTFVSAIVPKKTGQNPKKSPQPPPDPLLIKEGENLGVFPPLLV